MSLIELSKGNAQSFEGYLARQIVAFAGDGHLRDKSECAAQLRAYLRTVSADRLERYAKECLEQSFTDSGFFLQDVVNELGRRLEFEVENGRYRGTSNAIGFDGVWNVPDGPTIVIEVKTTDTYNVSLDTVAEYRTKLTNSGALSGNTSILFVVGRKDTGALEAQIRGSRYAWDMRVVGVESLLRLVRVKEKSSEDQTVTQIRELLRPFEYTRVDRILDVVFSATTDAVQPEDGEENSSSDEPQVGSFQQDRTPQTKIEHVRVKAVEALNRKLDSNLVRKRQAMFEDKEAGINACITVSKRYDDKLQPYWYAFHPKWDQFLQASAKGYMIFGCVDKDEAYAVPLSKMREFLPSLNQTIRPDGAMYWHVKLSETDSGMVMFASKTGEKFDLSQYSIQL
jgi:hypothetical protein